MFLKFDHHFEHDIPYVLTILTNFSSTPPVNKKRQFKGTLHVIRTFHARIIAKMAAALPRNNTKKKKQQI